jgi:hypothetical protein
MPEATPVMLIVGVVTLEYGVVLLSGVNPEPVLTSH